MSGEISYEAGGCLGCIMECLVGVECHTEGSGDFWRVTTESCFPFSTVTSTLSLPDPPPWASWSVVLSSVCSERPYASWASLTSFSQWFSDLSLFVQLVLSRPLYVHEFVPNLHAVSWLIGTGPGRPDMARRHGGRVAQLLDIAEAQLGQE